MTMGHSPLWTSTYSGRSWGITGLLMDRSQRWWMICSLRELEKHKDGELLELLSTLMRDRITWYGTRSMLWKHTRVLNLALEISFQIKCGHGGGPLSASDHLVQQSICDTVGSNSQHTIWAGLWYSTKRINTHAIMIILTKLHHAYMGRFDDSIRILLVRQHPRFAYCMHHKCGLFAQGLLLISWRYIENMTKTHLNNTHTPSSSPSFDPLPSLGTN